LKELRTSARRNPVVALLGARQVGKTTLARMLTEKSARTLHFDLESSRDLARLADPMLALEGLRGTVVLDEVQRRPEIFPTLRVLADRPRTPCRFLVLGSASPDLLRQSSESLAGRIAFQRLNGLALDEVGEDRLDRLWLRGGFPPSYVARSEKASLAWRRDFMRTFLERDMPQLGVRTPAETLRRFWTMLAHFHGQVWNASELGRALGANDKTARSYLDLLCSTFVIRRLPPWHANLKKRQVKSPKVYLSDSGLLHALLGITTMHDLRGHPKSGASWEGFMLEQVLERLGAHEDEAYFWSVHSGPELDLLVVRGAQRLGFELKLTVAPSVTRSMQSAMEALHLSRLHVVHAGNESFALGRGIQALAACRLWADLPRLR
jgi:hypothetical protein